MTGVVSVMMMLKCSFTPHLFHLPKGYSEDPGSVDGGVDPLVSRYRGGLMIVFFILIVYLIYSILAPD